MTAYEPRLSRGRAKAAKYRLDDLYRDFGGICHLCDKPVLRQQATRDHIVPRAEAKGTNAKQNIALAHRSCNTRRGNLTVEQFRDLLVRRPFVNGIHRWRGSAIAKEAADAKRAAIERRRGEIASVSRDAANRLGEALG